MQVEGYNGLPFPNDHTYYTRTINAFAPAAYLYLPDNLVEHKPAP